MFLHGNPTQYNAETINLRCPHCGHNGAFGNVGQNDVSDGVMVFGVRRCPNLSCEGIVFVVNNHVGDDIITFPPEVLDFDASNIPDLVARSLWEAIICHSQKCFKAAALMVRRTLEDLCADKNLEGANLFEKIEALGKTIIVPPELIKGAHSIRFLGNDAAHVESEIYNNIGEREVLAAIRLAKELLKGVYQYGSLVEELEELKKSNAEKADS
jgi:hypothetical protein